jgi:hypothetical protein
MPPIVLVIWEDAKVLTEGAWAVNQEYEYIPHMVSQVGFLLLDVPDGIHITEAWHPELIGPVEQIPRGMIKELKFLAPA